MLNKLNDVDDMDVVNFMQEFGSAIREEFLETGNTRSSLAEATSKNPNTIANCFNGKNPNLSTVIAIALSADLDLGELFRVIQEDYRPANTEEGETRVDMEPLAPMEEELRDEHPVRNGVVDLMEEGPSIVEPNEEHECEHANDYMPA